MKLAFDCFFILLFGIIIFLIINLLNVTNRSEPFGVSTDITNIQGGDDSGSVGAGSPPGPGMDQNGNCLPGMHWDPSGAYQCVSGGGPAPAPAPGPAPGPGPGPAPGPAPGPSPGSPGPAPGPSPGSPGSAPGPDPSPGSDVSPGSAGSPSSTGSPGSAGSPSSTGSPGSAGSPSSTGSPGSSPEPPDTGGWSQPMNNLGHHDGFYQYANTCSSPETHVTGPCGSEPAYSNTINAVKNVCAKGLSNLTFGHSMYDGQPCGGCVLMKCDDSQPGARPCADKTPFYQMRTDVETWSREIGTDFVNKHWGGEEKRQADQWYVYKKVPCP